jgi:hypothetical protein
MVKRRVSFRNIYPGTVRNLKHGKQSVREPDPGIGVAAVAYCRVAQRNPQTAIGADLSEPSIDPELARRSTTTAKASQINGHRTSRQSRSDVLALRQDIRLTKLLPRLGGLKFRELDCTDRQSIKGPHTVASPRINGDVSCHFWHCTVRWAEPQNQCATWGARSSSIPHQFASLVC